MREFSWRRGRQGQPGRLRRRRAVAIAGVTTGLIAANLLVTSVANAGVTTAAAPRSAAAEAVPWRSVGAGWVLAEYATGTTNNLGTTTLELVSPAGTKYRLHTWAAKSVLQLPTLAAWSPSKTEVLLEVWGNAYAQFDRMNLMTGKIRTIIKLPLGTNVRSYTLPTGLQLLADDITSTATTWTERVERLTKTGLRVKTIITMKHTSIDADPLDPVYAPDGASIAIGYRGGLAVVSNAGGAVKKLPVTGPGAKLGCTAVRWWNARTILGRCAGQLWLVPANGAKPTALTPNASIFAAWHLPSGLYLNELHVCTLSIRKQKANGSITALHIPGLGGPRILTAAGPRLLIDNTTLPCTGSTHYRGDSMAWYNPGTKAKHVLFAKGVFGTLPFPNLADIANSV